MAEEAFPEDPDREMFPGLMCRLAFTFHVGCDLAEGVRTLDILPRFRKFVSDPARIPGKAGVRIKNLPKEHQYNVHLRRQCSLLQKIDSQELVDRMQSVIADQGFTQEVSSRPCTP